VQGSGNRLFMASQTLHGLPYEVDYRRCHKLSVKLRLCYEKLVVVLIHSMRALNQHEQTLGRWPSKADDPGTFHELCGPASVRRDQLQPLIIRILSNKPPTPNHWWCHFSELGAQCLVQRHSLARLALLTCSATSE
jgi:hypothetical protein